MTDQNPIPLLSLVLAGGAGRRMDGRDKPLELWRDTPLIEHALARLPAAPIVISANRNQPRYRTYGHPVMPDQEANLGPLGGIASTAAAYEPAWLYVVAGDTPLLPLKLANQLLSACVTHGADAAHVMTDRRQPLPLLVNQAGLARLPEYLANGGRSVHGWLDSLAAITIDRSAEASAFANFNTLEDLNS